MSSTTRPEGVTSPPPRKAHRQTDYFRFEEPGFDPNLVKKELSRRETALGPSVRQVGRGEVAPIERLSLRPWSSQPPCMCAAPQPERILLEELPL